MRLGVAFRVPLQNPGMLAVRVQIRGKGSSFSFRVASRRLRFVFRIAFRVPLQNPRLLAFRAQVCV